MRLEKEWVRKRLSEDFEEENDPINYSVLLIHHEFEGGVRC